VSVAISPQSYTTLWDTIVAVDLANLNQSKGQLQSAADSAALAAAREMRLGNVQAATIDQVARNYVNSLVYSSTRLANATTTTAVSSDFQNVTVKISASANTIFANQLGLISSTVSASARASVKGGAPLCMLTLARQTLLKFGLNVGANSNISAPGCSLYSNEENPTGLIADVSARVSAASVCSAGGLKGNSLSFSSAPQLDCPALPDPLISRPAPSSATACDYSWRIIDGQVTTLNPGVYCGGLILRNNAVVTLNPGVYVIKTGALIVTNGATLKGADVGFYFTGMGAFMQFQATSTIDLSAPRTGPMAGILLWESNDVPVGLHIIASTQARNLLGTIYLPKSLLEISSPNPVADQSAYTIVVAGVISVRNSSLVLNTNYGATDVPVPSGVGRTAGNVVLDR